MSDLDQKQIDRLYKLLHEKEKSDPATATSLRWAIFQLEQKDREKQTGDLVFRLAFTPEPEIDSIMDTGVFNEIVKGYLVIAMREANIEQKKIQKAIYALDDAFNFTDAAAARKAYSNNDVDPELAEYEAELHNLIVKERKEIRRRINEAREKGDLSENQDYGKAKWEQSKIEERIEELEKLIEDAKNRKL